MPLIAKDGTGAVVNLKASGDGSNTNEFVVEHADANVGARADSAATSDTGTFSLIALLKRLLSTKLPDAVSGRVPTDGSLTTYGNPTLAVPTSLSTAVIFDCSKFKRLRIQINNTGSNALNGFEISTRGHGSGDYQVHLNTSTHYTSPTAGGILKHCADLSGASASPTTLAAGGKVVMAIDLTQFFAETIRIRATSAAATNLQIYWGAE